MSDAKTLIDTTVGANGGTSEGTFDVRRSDRSLKIYVAGDSNSTNLTVQLLAKPDETSTWYFVDGTEKSGKDVTSSPNNAVVLQFDYRPADEVKVRLINEAGSDTSVTVKTKAYLAI